MKKMKNLLAMILCLLMVITCAVPAYAESEVPENGEDVSSTASVEEEDTETESGLTEEQKALYDAILSCTSAEEYAALLDQTDPALVDSMSAALNEDENAALSAHIEKLNQPVTVAEEDNLATGVTITDTIKTNGSLTATPVGGDNSVTYTYQWYVSDNGTDFEKIENTSTVTGTDQKMYVARDGAQKYYKVDLLYNGKVIKKSDSFRVDYNASLLNGGFEDPKNTGDTAGPQYAEVDVPYWNTTGKGTGNKTGSDIEILSVCKSDSISNFNLTRTEADQNLLKATITTNSSQNKPGGGPSGGGPSGNQTTIRYTGVPDGTQCAELNCEAWGALYQDVLTEPGSTLYWAFYHRGRFGLTEDDGSQMDTLQLIIINADGIQEDWNPAGNVNTDYVQTTSSANALKWVYSSGKYIVPEGQYVTRFYFVSVESYNKTSQSVGEDATVGNYLDGVHFSKDVPDAPASYSNLTITKTVEDSIKSYVPAKSFTFSVSNGTVTKEVELPTESGEWSVSLLTLDPGEWTVTETTTELEGFTYTGTSVSGSPTSSTASANVNMVKGNNYQLIFENTYTENQVKINYVALDGGTVDTANETLGIYNGVAKGSTATAEDGYKFVGWYDNEECTGMALCTEVSYTPTKPDTGWEEATYYAKFEPAVANLTITKTGANVAIDPDQSFIFTITGPEDFSMDVVITGNSSVTIQNLPIGTYTVTEKTDWSWRYEPESNSQSITLTAEGAKVTFTNKRTENKWLSNSSAKENQFTISNAEND